jgi:peptidoglycan/xylan/chitin deacetylase (PgdA/CDA1 family)
MLLVDTRTPSPSRGLILILLVSLAGTLARGATAPTIRVVLRYDDPSERSNAEMETRLIETMRQYGMVCTFAIIPSIYADALADAPSVQECTLPVWKAKQFASAARDGVLELAQHGCTHRPNGMGGPKPSEFAGLPYHEQLSAIQKGRTLLEAALGMEVKIFVPPFNTYDANTVRAVDDSGFSLLSADMWQDGLPASGMAFLPATCSPVKVREAVACARRVRDPAAIIVVLFHEYDFLEINSSQGIMTFDQFQGTLQWLSEQPDVRIVPMREVADAGSRRFAANRRLLSTPRYLPYGLRGHLYPLLLLSEEGAATVLRVNRPILRLLGFYGLLALLAALAGNLVIGRVLAGTPVIGPMLLVFSAPVLALSSLAWAFHTGHFGGHTRMVVAIVAAAGYGLGVWGLTLRRRGRMSRATSPSPSGC